MSKKIFKSVFLSSIFTGLLLVISPKALAADFSMHEVTLERQGNQLI